MPEGDPVPSLRGLVFNIQRFCTHDGPGIRTTVFLKGCPLSCLWCHNPESRGMRPELLYHEKLCAGCGSCDKVCPQSHPREIIGARATESCHVCRRCADACPYGAIEMCGERRSVGQVLREVEEDRIFFEESGGGLTLSGGEPLAQPEFTIALAAQARQRGIPVCVETSGVGSRQTLETLVPLVEHFLWDLKHTDPLVLKEITGANLAMNLERLEMIGKLGASIILRCIVTQRWHARRRHWERVAEIARGIPGLLAIHLLPCHPLGASKRQALKLPSTQAQNLIPRPDTLAMAGEILSRQGFDVMVCD